VPVGQKGTLTRLVFCVQLPRPKWLSGNSRSTTLLLSTPAGTLLRRLAIALHALVILK
jgi:hypothetical protein